MIGGTFLALDRDTSEALLASLGRVRNQAPRDVAVVARELGIEADAERLAGMLTPDMLLGLGAFLVTNPWLNAALKSAQGSAPRRNRWNAVQRLMNLATGLF